MRVVISSSTQYVVNFTRLCCADVIFVCKFNSRSQNVSLREGRDTPSLLPAVLLFSVESFRSSFKLLWPRPHCFLKTFSLSNSLSKRECSLIEVVFIRFPLCWCLNPSHPFRYCSLAEPHICKGLDKLIPGLFLFANFFSQIHIGPAQTRPNRLTVLFEIRLSPRIRVAKNVKTLKTEIFAA